MRRIVGTAVLVTLPAAPACGGKDAPDASVAGDAAPDSGAPADAAAPDAAPPDASSADAGSPPPPAHPPRLAFVSGNLPYLVEWHDGVPQAPVALADDLGPSPKLEWSYDGQLLMLVTGAGLYMVAFDDSGPLPAQWLPPDCPDCVIESLEWAPGAHRFWQRIVHFIDDKQVDDAWIDMVDVAADGSFGAPQQIAFNPNDEDGDVFPLIEWAPSSQSVLFQSSYFYVASLALGRPDGTVSGISPYTISSEIGARWCSDSGRIMLLDTSAPFGQPPPGKGLCSVDVSGATPGPLVPLAPDLDMYIFDQAPDCHAVIDMTGSAAYAIDTSGSQPGEPVELGPVSRSAAWSPDSRWMVTESSASDAMPALYAYDTSQAIPWTRTPILDHSSSAQWRADSGQLLVASDATHPSTYLVGVSSTGFTDPMPLPAPQGAPGVSSAGGYPWSSDGRLLVYRATVAGAQVHGVIDTSGATPTIVRELGPGAVAAVPWAPGTHLLAFRAQPGAPADARLQVIDPAIPGSGPVTVDDGMLVDRWAWAP
jgi:hypothetical protein